MASTFESLAAFAGPAFAGLLLVVAEHSLGLRSNGSPRPHLDALRARIDAPKSEVRRELEAGTIVSESLAGFRTIGRIHRCARSSRSHRTDLLLGALQVFLVVTAFESWTAGAAGVGLLNSVWESAPLSAGSGTLTDRLERLSPVVSSVSFSGAPQIALGSGQPLVGALVLFALLGVGNHRRRRRFTLVQRAVPDEILARVFGVVQMLWLASVGTERSSRRALID